MIDNSADDAGGRPKLRVRKLDVSKFVAPAEAPAKRRRSRESIDVNGPVGYAIKTRRLCSAARASDRTDRVLRGFIAKDGGLGGMVGFVGKSIVLARTPI